MTVLKRSTITDGVREKLADEILLGVFPAGVRLDEQMLAERYGVSRTPVREALKQLSATGLVEAKPHKGVFVTQVTPDRLEALFEAVADLEAVCARHAAVRMSRAERLALEALHVSAQGAVEQADFDRYDVLNRQFHGMILTGCRNEFLVEAVTRLRVQTTPYRRAQFRQRERIEQSFAEHRPIMEAILSGDADAAERQMRAHLGRAADASAGLLARPAGADRVSA